MLKITLDHELAREYDTEGVSPPHDASGTGLLRRLRQAGGLCDEAWKAIYQYVFALAHGAENQLLYYGDWIWKPSVAIYSCDDGLKPVIFKLEATDEASTLDDTPVG